MLGTTRDDPVVGALLDGRYRVVSLIGRGGMGNVYLAEETRLRRRCALKVLHEQLAEDRVHVERFLREAQTIAQFEHENIVDIYSYGEEPSGVVFFAMELLSGEDLDARIKARSERPFSVHEGCLWALQAARAVATVHEAGLIHRDLKTSNLFLARRRDGDEVVKLLDFGIARSEDGSELTRTGLSLGTPGYMSPEQIRSGEIDRRSDIYSFGVLLFKVLTHRLPFTGEPIQIAMQHCETPPPRPSAIAPEAGISPALEAIILKCMAKRTTDRYASMREVEQALFTVLQDEAPELTPATRTSRTAGRSGVHLGPVSVVTSQSAIAPLTDTTQGNQAALSTGATAAMERSRSGGAFSRIVLLGSTAVLGAMALAVAVMLAKGGAKPAPVADDAPPPAPAVATVPAPVLEPRPAEAPPAEASSLAVPTVVPNAEPAPLPPPDHRVEAAPSTPPSAVDRPIEAKKPKAAQTSADPLKQIERKAQICRRNHRATSGPKITIDYAVGVDGKVTRSIPSNNDALGRCLADAVTATRFEPKLVLGRKITL